MTKNCFSIITPEFEKELASMGEDAQIKIINQIARLEEMENDRSKIPNGYQSPESVVGDRLTVLNKNTFALKTANWDRALAVVHKEQGKKIFIWYWTGSHESYNRKLKAAQLASSEKSTLSKNQEAISEGIKQLLIQDVAKNIQEIRKNAHISDNKKLKKRK